VLISSPVAWARMVKCASALGPHCSAGRSRSPVIIRTIIERCCGYPGTRSTTCVAHTYRAFGAVPPQGGDISADRLVGMMNGMTRRRAAIFSAGSHLVFAVVSFTFAAWLAVDSSGGRCDDTASCLEVNSKLFVFGAMAYVCAFGLWTCVQSRLLRSLFGRKSPRQTSAAVLNVVAGITALIIGLALGGGWFVVGFCLASAAIPGLVTSWAAQPLDPSHPYVPVGRRPGW
jgi:hypothetical protein